MPSPFSGVEHPTFSDFFKSLCPEYILPTHNDLSGPLVNRVSDDLHSAMKVHLDGQTVTLVEDGSSNVHNDPVLAISVQTENATFFF